MLDTLQKQKGMNMVHLGQYISRRSFIHGLDPRIKILCVILLSFMILKAEVLSSTLCTGFLLALIPVSRISPKSFLSSLRPVLPFLLLLFSLHLLFTQGTPIPPFPAWRVTVTFEGLTRGLLVAWPFALLVLSASFLTMTTSPSELVSGLERLLRPLRFLGIPSYDVAIMVSVALRFVPTILEEIRLIREAQTARCANFSTGSILKRARNLVALLVPLLTNAFRRADELTTAMEGRGYSGGPRTTMRELHLSTRDYGTLAVVILLVGLLLLQQAISPVDAFFPGVR